MEVDEQLRKIGCVRVARALHVLVHLLPLVLILYDFFSQPDIDECQEQSDLCAHGRCRNTPGSFTCDCDPRHIRMLHNESCEGIAILFYYINFK